VSLYFEIIRLKKAGMAGVNPAGME
jgi:hypothetical protein